MDVYLLLDMIEILAGVYLVFLAFRMKKTGVVSDNGLISKGLDLSKAPDPKGYIEKMFPWNILLGSLLAIAGGVSRFSATTEGMEQIQLISTTIAIITVVVYAFCSMKAQRKYLEP